MENYSCSNLSFYYGKKCIFDNVSFEIKKGDIVALVGENGSGKTSFLKILGGIYKIPNFKLNYNVTYMFDKSSFYPYLTGFQNLKYFAYLYKIKNKKIYEVLQLVGLFNVRNVKFKKYSFGMKQKLALARMLLIESELYLFDEPLNGLDPTSILKFKEIINYLSSKNKTIVISSHILKEISQYTNKAMLIKNNKIINVDTQKYSYYILTIENFDNDINLEKIGNNEYKYYKIDKINELLKYFVYKNITINKIRYIENNLEDIFLMGLL